MACEELINEELLENYKVTVESLPGSVSRGHACIAEVEKELLDRLNQSN